jgi:hypothetical protein
MTKDNFNKLLNMPASDPFWRNDLMFTRDVFTNNSRQGNDQPEFEAYLKSNRHVKNLLKVNGFI